MNKIAIFVAFFLIGSKISTKALKIKRKRFFYVLLQYVDFLNNIILILSVIKIS